jgi:hypothetical protein
VLTVPALCVWFPSGLWLIRCVFTALETLKYTYEHTGPLNISASLGAAVGATKRPALARLSLISAMDTRCGVSGIGTVSGASGSRETGAAAAEEELRQNCM